MDKEATGGIPTGNREEDFRKLFAGFEDITDSEDLDDARLDVLHKAAEVVWQNAQLPDGLSWLKQLDETDEEEYVYPAAQVENAMEEIVEVDLYLRLINVDEGLKGKLAVLCFGKAGPCLNSSESLAVRELGISIFGKKAMRAL